MFYELLVGHPPFMDKSPDSFEKKLKDGNYEFSKNLKISPEAMHFISRCLQYTEEVRASVLDLYFD
jgi:serine/threonine protein kinase